MLLGVAWALWAAGWIRRVELRHALEPTIRALGLSWLPQGIFARVAAAGAIAGQAVYLRARLRGGLPEVQVRIGTQPWTPVATDAETIRALVPPS